jgi:hypothetical protein
MRDPGSWMDYYIQCTRNGETTYNYAKIPLAKQLRQLVFESLLGPYTAALEADSGQIDTGLRTDRSVTSASLYSSKSLRHSNILAGEVFASTTVIGRFKRGH